MADPSDPEALDGDDDARAILDDALAFAAAEASLLDELSGFLDLLRAADAADTAGHFDTEAIWERVAAQVWGAA